MKNTIIFLLLSLTVMGCKKLEETDYSVNTTNESAQQIGDAMAGIDESGGKSDGSTAQYEFQSSEKAFARLTNGEPVQRMSLLRLAVPEAQAAACSTLSFGTISCNAGQKVLSFNDCTVGTSGSISGSITLNFSQNACTMAANGDYVARVPNFTISGVRGASFTVKTASTGQKLTRDPSAGVFKFSNTGIQRKFVTPKGTTLLDVTTATSGDVTVTTNSGARLNRTLSGGSLVVTNNLTGITCSMSPNAVKWGSSSCNCPTEGKWAATCSDSKTFEVQFSGVCGEVMVNNNGAYSQINLDRCQ